MSSCPGVSSSSSVPWGQPWPGVSEGSGLDVVPCSPALPAKVAQSTPGLQPPEHCCEGRSQTRPLGAQQASVLLRPGTRVPEESAPPGATNRTLLQTRMKVCLSGSWGARGRVLSGPRNWQQPSARSGWGNAGRCRGGEQRRPTSPLLGAPDPECHRAVSRLHHPRCPEQGCLVSAKVGSTQLPPPSCSLARDGDAAVQVGTGS